MENIVIDKQSDWGGNFKLHIQNKETNEEFSLYTVCSMYKGIPVGFEIQVPIHLQTFGDGVVFSSLGVTSDNFIKFLYSIYNLNEQENLRFINSIACKYTDLNDLPYKSDGQKRLSHINYIKIFLQGHFEDEYAELFINIDEPNQTIELEEKDYEYRPYVAMLLSAE